MLKREMLDRLIENALDFLDNSLTAFDKKPKYSVIHFCAAVELFLKARLMAEHWSLVVTKRQEPDWKKFESGDFISVSLDESADKLEKVVQSALTKPELECFRNLTKHRNRMMHFFHEAHSKNAAGKLRQSIAREQLHAWYYLNKLLTERWERIFNKWKKDIDIYDKKFMNHRGYLLVVFEHVQLEIERQKEKGAEFKKCPSCGFDSLEIMGNFGEFFSGRCLVCQLSEMMLEIECTECGNIVTFKGEGFGKCQKCGQNFEPEDIMKMLTKNVRGTKYYYEKRLPANCTECDKCETVIEQDDILICVSCFQSFNEEDLHECEWCGNSYVGEIQDDFESGCVVCEGHSGYHRDDD